MSPRIPWVKAFSRRTQGRIHVRLCAMSAKGWEKAMKGYIHNIERATRQNKTFRTVLYTAKNCQLVVMSLKPGEDIGAEVHKLDQFFRVEEGEGKAVLEGIEHRIKPGFAILVPAGTRHNIINGPSGPMKLYTLLRSTEPSRWRSARHQGGGRGRQRAFRREDDRIAIGPTSGRTVRLRSRRPGYFFSKSRISARSFTSGVGSVGGAGGSSFFSLLIPLMARNKTPAMIRKFKATVRN